MSFLDKKVSTKRAIDILEKNGTQVDEGDAIIILDFLYLIAKNSNMLEVDQNSPTLKRNRTSGKVL